MQTSDKPEYKDMKKELFVEQSYRASHSPQEKEHQPNNTYQQRIEVWKRIATILLMLEHIKADVSCQLLHSPYSTCQFIPTDTSSKHMQMLNILSQSFCNPLLHLLMLYSQATFRVLCIIASFCLSLITM